MGKPKHQSQAQMHRGFVWPGAPMLGPSLTPLTLPEDEFVRVARGAWGDSTPLVGRPKPAYKIMLKPADKE